MPCIRGVGSKDTEELLQDALTVDLLNDLGQRFLGLGRSQDWQMLAMTELDMPGMSFGHGDSCAWQPRHDILCELKATHEAPDKKLLSA
ncbi:MAG: hypothetical protein D4R65_03060 [Verrucomicrobiaceae bacterium]|nr:MAG: hypothetical protein D4R65_03060 [Verrucomicrobiaceae bacterium]